MPTPIQRLQHAVSAVPGILAGYSEAESEQLPGPGRWTKKEVLGHLIDSAINNLGRFVRAQLAGHYDAPGYDQQAWVRVQRYQQSKWSNLIDLWRAINVHLLHVITVMPEEARRATCRVAGDAMNSDELTLDALFENYVTHMEHHLTKMLGRWPVA
jgi:hypothetical protein